MVWYNALLGHAPEPDARRARYRLPHGELTLTTYGRHEQYCLLLDSLDKVRPRLAGSVAHACGYVEC